MKPFNLERAKAGDPVQTRDGRKARIVCFDMKNDDYPIVAIVTENDGEEFVFSFTEKGTYYNFDNKDSIYLVMASKKVTKFVNIYKKKGGRGFYAGNLADSMEQAKEFASYHTNRLVYTQKLSWEE